MNHLIKTSMTKIEKTLKAIAAKSASQLTDAEKAFITHTSISMGVDFSPRNHCGQCYSDQAVVLWKRYKETKATKTDTRKYILREGVDVMFRGIRVNAATLTDALGDQLVAQGFPKMLFAICR